MPEKMLFVNGEDTYFLSHRLPAARAAVEVGLEVHVLTVDSGKRQDIEKMGFYFHGQTVARGKRNPFNLLRKVIHQRRIITAIKPQIVHITGIEQILTGGFSCLAIKNLTIVNSVNGLGYAFTSKSIKARCLKIVIIFFLRRIDRYVRSIFLFQNRVDRDEFEAYRIVDKGCVIIPGSGVDTKAYPASQFPKIRSTVVLGMACRMIETKGVREISQAMRKVWLKNKKIKLYIAGLPDPGNPETLRQSELDAIANAPNIELLGYVDNMKSFWSSCHIAVSTSYREGMSMALLQPASIGRPIIATDTAGNNDICCNEFNGLLVPVYDSKVLARRILCLAGKPGEMRRMAGNSLKQIDLLGLSAEAVQARLTKFYKKILNDY